MKKIFGWFKDNSKMKRWMMLILVGVIFASFGMANIIVSTDSITFKQAAKIIIYFVVGFTCIILGMIFFNKRAMELFIESTDQRSRSDKKINVNSLIFNKKIYDDGPNIVIIGGGSGLNTLLEGFKKYTSNITAIVTVSNYGETLAKDNDKMKYLQLEDIKNGIAALSLHENSKMLDLFNYRFKEGYLRGIAFSDIYFEAIKDISNGLAEAVKNSNEIFKIYGKVLPITEDKMKICAELGNGYVVEEKSKIASMVYDKLTKINRVYLSPSNCRPTPGVIEAIQNADSIIIGPGSLYTNVIPNLLVKGISRAIKESNAKKIYVCNIMTEPGLTDNYSVADHINSIIDHCGDGLIDYCLYDTGEIIPEIIKRYNKDGADLVEQNIQEIKDKKIKFIKKDLSMVSENCIRHNATIIADIVIQMICDDFKYMDKQNEPEYLLMNTKLKADKEISKKQKKALKKQKRGNNKKPKCIKNKSKFVNKYDERIKSIRESEQNIQRRKISIEQKEESIKKENYEKIRKEMLKKFNNNTAKK